MSTKAKRTLKAAAVAAMLTAMTLLSTGCVPQMVTGTPVPVVTP